MTAHVGSMSVDGTPISRADLARIEAEEALHLDQQRRAVRIVASVSTDVEDCRMLLSILGLGDDVIATARAEIMPPAPPVSAPKRPRKRRVAA